LEVGVTTVRGAYGVIGLRVPGAIAYRHLAIRLVSTACKMALESDSAVTSEATGEVTSSSEHTRDADGDFEAEVVSAFGEAFNNIAVHGFRDLPPEPVQIEVDWDHEKMVITCVDNGHIFDPETVALPDLDELPEHGMGLFIMRSCMDQVDYRPGPPNVLRLVKLRTRRDGLLPPPPSSRKGTSGHPGPASVRAVSHETHEAHEAHDGDEAAGLAGLPDGADSAGGPDGGSDGGRDSGVDLVSPANEGCIARVRVPGKIPGDDLMVESSRRR
jgi:serine/threonine-protein kinase RsbW